MKIEINTKGDPLAREVLECNIRHRRLAETRRGRKTSLGTLDSMLRALQGKLRRHMTVAPTYEQAEEAVLHAVSFYDDLISDYIGHKHVLVLKGGSRLYFRSADIPKNIRGKGYDHIHIIESANIDDMTYYRIIRPTISGKPDSTTFAEGTIDRAMGWFWKELQIGLRGDDPAFKGWMIDCYHSPYLSPKEIEELKRTLPKKIFENEYLCVPMIDGGTVFEHIRWEVYDWQGRTRSTDVSPILWGLDVAKEQDYTVLVGIQKGTDNIWRVVGFFMLRKMQYTQQMEMCSQILTERGGAVYFDKTGVGNAVIELLHYDDIVPITYNTDSKRQMVENAVVMCEKEDIVLPRGLEEMANQFASFTARKSAAGNIIYGAPEGLHDDIVMALCQALWGAKRETLVGAEWIG